MTAAQTLWRGIDFKMRCPRVRRRKSTLDLCKLRHASHIEDCYKTDAKKVVVICEVCFAYKKKFIMIKIIIFSFSAEQSLLPELAVYVFSKKKALCNILLKAILLLTAAHQLAHILNAWYSISIGLVKINLQESWQNFPTFQNNATPESIRSPTGKVTTASRWITFASFHFERYKHQSMTCVKLVHNAQVSYYVNQRDNRRLLDKTNKGNIMAWESEKTAACTAKKNMAETKNVSYELAYRWKCAGSFQSEQLKN